MLRQALTVRFARLIRLPVATVAAPPRLLLPLPGLPGLSRSFSFRFSSSSLQAAAAAGAAGDQGLIAQSTSTRQPAAHLPAAQCTRACSAVVEHDTARQAGRRHSAHCSASMCCIWIFSSSYSLRQLGQRAAMLALLASSRM